MNGFKTHVPKQASLAVPKSHEKKSRGNDKSAIRGLKAAHLYIEDVISLRPQTPSSPPRYALDVNPARMNMKSTIFDLLQDTYPNVHHDNLSQVFPLNVQFVKDLKPYLTEVLIVDNIPQPPDAEPIKAMTKFHYLRYESYLTKQLTEKYLAKLPL